MQPSNHFHNFTVTKIIKTLSMKTNLKLIFLVTFMFIACSGYSQTQRFIEVVSSDSIEVNALQYTYQITPGEQFEFLGMVYPSDKPLSDSVPKVQDITKVLDQWKFKYTISNNNSFTISKTDALPIITVELYSTNDLQQLYGVLEYLTGISGRIKNISYEPVSKYYDKAYERLYTKAYNQAKILAKVSGNTIGKLISISYIKSDQANYMENYMDYYKELLKGVKSASIETSELTKKSVEIKMLFKFALE
jgi:hypothetical protein